MNDKNRAVQVPVSLIKTAVHYLGRGGFRALTGQLQDALFSQPTVSLPTREQIAEALFYAARRDDWGVATGQEREEFYDMADAVLALFSQQPAGQSRIEDMALGTTFTGCVRGDVRRRWFLRERGSIVATDGSFAHTAALDPSTIRDVTSPKDAA